MNSGAFRQALFRWSIGMSVATPTISLFQAALLLHEYRTKHGHAPRPDVPCSGLVVVGSDPQDPDRDHTLLRRQLSSQRQAAVDTQQDRRHEPPLRLLVIGDSLAAGVGQSQSHEPVLPNSIAEVLSQAMNGRAVYWTCVGTPGLPSAKLVDDIHRLGGGIATIENSDRGDSSDNNNDNHQHWTPPKPPRPAVLQRLDEWQRESRQRAEERLRQAQQNAEDWLAQMAREEEQHDANVNANDWTRRWRRRVRQDLQHVVDWMRRQRVWTPPPPVVERKLTRRATLDPDVIGHYDIAVVLTGLNDVKDAFLPFMMPKEKNQQTREAGKDGFKGTLVRVVNALKEKMGLKTSSSETTSSKRKKFRLDDQRPLIVFPALPILPIEPGQRAPVSWFIVPIFRAMDHNKLLLSQMYPDLVVFVDSPPLSTYADVEAQRGPLWERQNRSVVLLKLSESQQQQQSTNRKSIVQNMMRQHFSQFIVDAEAWPCLYDVAEDGIEMTQLSPPRHPGASLVSFDGIHPNDRGYDFWGRYIGLEILKNLDLA